LFLVYTILCRTTFRSFACQDIDEGESFHQVSRFIRYCDLTLSTRFYPFADSTTHVGSDRLHSGLQFRHI
jgi:hypothetical protein